MAVRLAGNGVNPVAKGGSQPIVPCKRPQVAALRINGNILRPALRLQLLLLAPDLSITEVAMQSGFNSLSTFNRIFKAAKNCTPSSYKSLNKGTRLDTAGSPSL